MPDDLMESLEPYNYSELTDFQTAYLAGYIANKYDVDAERSIERANERIRSSTEAAFIGTVTDFANVNIKTSRLDLKSGGARYALLPIWLLNTKWNGKQYTFAMNGQTGRFVGDLPMDKGAFWRWFLGIFAGVAAAAFLLLSFAVR
jgi:hypothetical protein